MLCATAALCAVAALPGAAVADPDVSDPYAYDTRARTVQGAGSEGAAQTIELGAAYRSTIGPSGGSQGTLYYRMELGTAENVYASVTAVPGLGTEADYSDGLKVHLQDAGGQECSDGTAQFGSVESPWPVAAMAMRTIDPSASACQQAGTYYLVVERESSAGSPSDEWGLELSTASEPATLRTPGPTTPPGDGGSTPPSPPAQGQAEERRGGTGFSTAADLGQGIWRDSARPGQTLFYRVPVGWGQRVSATAELTGPGGAAGGSTGGGSMGAALVTWLYNPVRGRVGTADAAYDGSRASASLSSPAPVSYRNRYSTDPQIAAVRFAGWYYLAVHLNQQLADDSGDDGYGVTLRVAVGGAAQEGPGYAGAPQPQGLFDVPGGGATAGGDTTPSPADGNSLRPVGFTAIGVGTALLLVLATWTLLARRRHATAAPGPSPARRKAAATPTGTPDHAADGDPGSATDDGTDPGTGTGHGFGHVPGYSDAERYGSGYWGPDYGGYGGYGDQGAEYPGGDGDEHGRVEYGRVEYGAGAGRGAGAGAQHGGEYGAGHGRAEYGTGVGPGLGAAQRGGAAGHGAPQGGTGPYGAPGAW
ncbi:hypothetical protein [Streptomyces sp. TS71-3]|uniref:hypothetical protein n=1 Tax=Streptomyces sp. TS71-3 TaxID=2733862 RepID=UPI001AFF7500|nr:hypothetical protein [Streptomyces sp. TS71-3]GHJ40270.1 hypothetical protein Sm713_58790 [Streptomyces sp. TS71-3]